VGGITCTLCTTVLRENIEAVPGFVKWAERNIQRVSSLVFTTYRAASVNGAVRHMECGGEVDDSEPQHTARGPDAVYDLTARALHHLVWNDNPEWGSAGYLGGSLRHDSIKWLVSAGADIGGWVTTYIGPMILEMDTLPGLFAPGSHRPSTWEARAELAIQHRSTAGSARTGLVRRRRWRVHRRFLLTGFVFRARLANMWRCSLVMLAVALSGAPAARAEVPAFAVSPFENATGDPHWASVGQGFAELLRADLAQLSGLRVLERSQVRAAWDELALSGSPFADLEAALRLGRACGVDHLVTGTIRAVRPMLRIEVSVVKVADGGASDLLQASGSAADFHSLHQQLATRLVERLEISISADERERMAAVHTASFDAFVAWSRGLEAFDRGVLEEAAWAMEEALIHDDRFRPASEELVRIRQALEASERARIERLDAAVTSLSDSLLRMRRHGGSWSGIRSTIAELARSVNPDRDAAILRRACQLVLATQVPVNERFQLRGEDLGIHEWALGNLVLASLRMGDQDAVVEGAQTFLERYPTSALRPAVAHALFRLQQMRQRRDAGRAQLTRVQAEADAHRQLRSCASEPRPKLRLEACRGLARTVDLHDLPIPERSWSYWVRAAQRLGDLGEMERIEQRALSRPAQGLSAEAATEARARLEQLLKVADTAPQRAELADRAGALTQAARELADVGRRSDAEAVLRRGLKRWPREPLLYAEQVDVAVSFGDLRAAERALAVWRDAPDTDPTQGRLAKVEQLRHLLEDIELTEPDTLAYLAGRLAGIDQNESAAEVYLDLSRRFPDFPALPAAEALWAAAAEYDHAILPQAADDCLLELLARYPDDQRADLARKRLHPR
jgi:TolB-like protein/TolA-binding protein